MYCHMLAQVATFLCTQGKKSMGKNYGALLCYTEQDSIRKLVYMLGIVNNGTKKELNQVYITVMNILHY